MKSSKKIMLVAAVLLLAAALFVGAGAATGATQAEDDVAKLVNGGGTTYFTTFAEAYAALTKGDNAVKPATAEVITLLKDATTGGFGLDTDTKMNYVVDLGGHTLTVTTPGVGSTGYETQAVRLTQGSTATFKNGTLTVPSTNVDEIDHPIKQFVHNYGAMTLEDVTIDGTYTQQAMYGKSTPSPGPTYTIAAGYPSNYDSLTIKGNTVIKAPNNTSLVVNQPRIALEAATTGTTSIEAVGAKVPEIQGAIESAATTDNFTITAGSFTDLTALKYLGQNAKVNVTLSADAETGGWFLAKDKNVNVEINLGGKTWTVTDPAVGSKGTESQALHLEKNNTVTITNGTIISKAGATGIKMLIQNYCNLTLDDVRVNGSNLATSDSQYVLSNNCGNVVIKDTNFNTPTNFYTFDVCKFQTYSVPTVTVKGTVTADKIEVTGGNLVVSGDLTSKHIDVKTGKLTVEQGGKLTISTLDTLVIMGSASVEIIGNFEVEEDESGSVLGVELQPGAQMTLPADADFTVYAKFIKKAEQSAEIIIPPGTSGGNSTILSFNTTYNGIAGRSGEDAAADIVAKSTIIDGKTTTVTMKYDNTYTFNIPESIELVKGESVPTDEIYITNEKAELGVLKLVLDTNAKGSSETDITTFVLNGTNAATAEYKIKNNKDSKFIKGKQAAEDGGNVVLTLPMTTAQGKASTTLDFVQDGGSLTAAGQYTGTLTFTIRVDTA